MYCKNCGNKLDRADKFCVSCGTEVTGPAQPSTTTKAAAPSTPAVSKMTVTAPAMPPPLANPSIQPTQTNPTAFVDTITNTQFKDVDLGTALAFGILSIVFSFIPILGFSFAYVSAKGAGKAAPTNPQLKTVRTLLIIGAVLSGVFSIVYLLIYVSS